MLVKAYMSGQNRAPPTVERFQNTTRFLERAEPWLMESEAENNLILAIAHGQRGTASGHGESSVYLAVVAEQGEVRGCAFRTPPLKVGLTRMPPGAIEPLVDDLRSLY